MMKNTGSFELKKDETTGRLYWEGAEDGWKQETEIGKDGVITIDARWFKIGTKIKLEEPC